MTYDEMRIRQAWQYEAKIAHAKRVAGGVHCRNVEHPDGI